jgi:O-succinylbenzoate synthase
MAKAAVEAALLDAELRSLGIGLASYLGARRSRVPAGATVGLQPSPEAALDAAAEAASAGFSRLKLKIAPGADVAAARAVRLGFHELALQVDCNGAYRADEPSHMSALFELDQLGLLAIEQPLDPDDLVGHVDLVRRLRTPVLLDESAGSELASASALRLGACDGLVVKPARLGGVMAARRLHDVLVAARRPGAVGGMLESGVGRAASLAVAALPGFTIPGDLGPSERYFAADVTAPHTMEDGSIAVPDGPGIGVAPLAEVLDSCATLRAEVPVRSEP